MEHTADYIINAKPVQITKNEQIWYLRQPTSSEVLDAESAFRLTFERVVADKRLRDLAGGEDALKIVAIKRACAAEALYMLPVLILNREQKPIFNPSSPASLKEFEKTDSETIALWVTEYFKLTRLGVDEIKKK